ncbi:MAG: hypothetical protein JWM08_828 [Candidatus Angelobacter sp.]|nr:hypothetical protein [Candidatus Angelobacter sp.]
MSVAGFFRYHVRFWDSQLPGLLATKLWAHLETPRIRSEAADRVEKDRFQIALMLCCRLGNVKFNSVGGIHLVRCGRIKVSNLVFTSRMFVEDP